MERPTTRRLTALKLLSRSYLYYTQYKYSLFLNRCRLLFFHHVNSLENSVEFIYNSANKKCLPVFVCVLRPGYHGNADAQPLSSRRHVLEVSKNELKNSFIVFFFFFFLHVLSSRFTFLFSCP